MTQHGCLTGAEMRGSALGRWKGTQKYHVSLYAWLCDCIRKHQDSDPHFHRRKPGIQLSLTDAQNV